MIKNCIHSLFYNLEQTARICRVGCESYFEQHSEISLDEFIILDTVSCYPNICQRDLAKMILKGASHTSKILATLEQRGIIERILDQKGNRVIKKIRITKTGQDIYKAASIIALDFANKIEESIDKTQAIEYSKFLNRIKETVTNSVNITFE